MKNILLNQYERPTRTHYKIFGLSWAGWVFDFYDLILFTFLIIPIGAELHLSNLMLSYALSASIIAAAIGGVVFGVLSDKYGRKVVLQWTIIIYSVGTLLCAFSTSLETLIIFRIITGLGVGGEWATGQTYVNETFPAKLRGRFGALLTNWKSSRVYIGSFGRRITCTYYWMERSVSYILYSSSACDHSSKENSRI